MSVEMNSFRWVPRSLTNTSVFGCPVCMIPLCFYDDVVAFHGSYLSVNPLLVANLLRTTNNDVYCVGNHQVGRLNGNSLYLYRPVRLSLDATTDAGADAKPREWTFLPGNYPFPVWGCICCQRPVGTGFGFTYHYCQPASFVNVVPSSTDANVVKCLCGCYIGYNYQGVILVGEVYELLRH